MLIDGAGLLAAAALLVTLVSLEFQRSGQDAGQPVRPRILGRTVSLRIIALIWTLYLIFFLPRVLGLML